MRRMLFLILALQSLVSKAEENAKEVSIEDLQIKNSPAFVAIGVEPTTVQKPGSAKTFGVALASAMGSSGSDGSSLANIALDTSPYWWYGGGNLTFEEYYGLDPKDPNKSNTPNAMLTAMRTLTFSLATKDQRIAPESGDTSGSSLGIGFRTKFLLGKLTTQAATQYIKLKDILYKESGNISKTDLEKFKDIPENGQIIETNSHPFSSADLAQDISTALSEFRKLLKNPYGFQIEGAGGLGFESNEKNLSSPKLKRWGVWANASYKPKSEGSFFSSIDMVSMIRYIGSKLKADADFNAFDVGCKLLWSKARQPLAVSMEYIYRFDNRENTKKFALMVEYCLSENTSVYITNGKDFGNETTGKREAFTYLGLNFSVGSGSKVLIPKPI